MEIRENKKKKSRKRGLLLLLLLLLIGVGIFLYVNGRSTPTEDPTDSSLADSLRREQEFADSVKRAKEIADSIYNSERIQDSLAAEQEKRDSLKRAQELLDSIAKADSLNRAKALQDSINRAKALQDSLNRAKRLRDSINRAKALKDSTDRENKRVADSIANAKRIADSTRMANDPCVKDTIIPWVYPKPSGGLHPKPVKVKFVSTEKCEIKWKFEGETAFRIYDGKPFMVSKNCVLLYSAVDECGNSFSQKRKRYEIAEDNSSKCPEGMAYIPSNGGFCIDKYEWPNKQGKRPTSNVSFSQASDSCFTIGKRLCEASEWESCCRGPYSWNYPYGPNYLSRACVTEDRSAKGAGKAGECRGWYDVYDLVGNLAEWTATKSNKKSGFYVVKGGFWDSGTRSSCKLSRHSYFTQNPHNPVGFRCCKDIDE